MQHFKPYFRLVILLFLNLLLSEAREVRAQILTDKEFFQSLNLNYPGLEKVNASVAKGDYTAAKKAFVIHLKSRTSPKWYVDWHDFNKPGIRNTKADLVEADRYASDELLSCDTWYKFKNKIDWTSNHSPNNYDEWTWQLNRFYHWTVLGKAYWATGDEKYAKAFVRQLNSWIDQCALPMKSFNGVGSAWRTIETGIRALGNWPDSYNYFLSSPTFDDESIIKMVKSFYEHGLHLREHNTSGNWLSLEMRGLYTVGALFPEFKESAEWRNYASNRLYEEELTQFYPDGSQVELSPSYHSLSGSSIVGVYKLAQLNDYQLPDEYIRRLESTYDYYLKLMLPDGTMPAVNDSKWVDASSYIKEAVDLFPKRSDFRYILSNGTEGHKPSFTSTWMPWAGWYVMRSGWNREDFYALFEVGPFGSAHQHEDKLNVILYAYGRPLITECGIYAYDYSDWYKYSISARGHNVARVDGKDQNRSAQNGKTEVLYSQASLKNIWKSNRKYDYGEGNYTEGYGANLDKSVTHTRSVKFVKNKYWVVSDTFTPSDNTNHTYESWFHFNSSQYELNKDLGIVYSSEPGASNVVVVPLGDDVTIEVAKGEKKQEVQGWVSKYEGNDVFQMKPVATPIFHFEGQGVKAVHYVFIPYRTNEDMPVKSIKRKSSRKYVINLNNGNKYTIKL